MIFTNKGNILLLKFLVRTGFFTIKDHSVNQYNLVGIIRDKYVRQIKNLKETAVQLQHILRITHDRVMEVVLTIGAKSEGIPGAIGKWWIRGGW
jgi:hypothetical protein